MIGYVSICSDRRYTWCILNGGIKKKGAEDNKTSHVIVGNLHCSIIVNAHTSFFSMYTLTFHCLRVTHNNCCVNKTLDACASNISFHVLIYDNWFRLQEPSFRKWQLMVFQNFYFHFWLNTNHLQIAIILQITVLITYDASCLTTAMFYNLDFVTFSTCRLNFRATCCVSGMHKDAICHGLLMILLHRTPYLESENKTPCAFSCTSFQK